jgi:arylsulfatase A-like enzyme
MLGVALGLMMAHASGCTRAKVQPSLVLVVLDTTRADAVSAYGEVKGTTPTLDRLAAEGILYEHAYSNSNWTLPSHASLFTGVLPPQNGVRGGADQLGDVPTVSELLARAGYETFAVSENPWLSSALQLQRRFNQYQAARYNLVDLVRTWAQGRDQTRPFFLFVNIMDAHAPYRVREQNPHLPPGVDAAEAKAIPQAFGRYVCRAGADDPALKVLHGLYLGNVHAADAKLASVLDVLQPLRAQRPMVVIVTSDHGEYFGEHRLVEHRVGVGNPVLHVPLVVHGLPDVRPARVRAPVQLVDVAPSLLAWADVAIPNGLFGERLPTTESATERRQPIIAFYDDYMRSDPRVPQELRNLESRNWTNCAADHRVFGDMRALIRFPQKLVWYAEHPPQLFDLAADPGEERDLARTRPEAVAALQKEVERIATMTSARPTVSHMQLEPAQVEQLRALGYLGGSGQPVPGDR